MKSVLCLSGKRRVHSVSGGHLLTERNRRFSEAYTAFISDLYRVLTIIAEVNTDIALSVLTFVLPLLP